MRNPYPAVGLAFVLASAFSLPAYADAPGNPAAVKQDDGGVWRDKNGDPTYKIEPDGKVDWATYEGYRRYNSTCEVCHGFDGNGSSFAPALKDSLKTMSYAQFYGIVLFGRKDLRNGQDLVMPAWQDNKNVMCYLDDIYVYLRARSTNALAGGRPAEHAPKPADFTAAEDKCMGPTS